VSVTLQSQSGVSRVTDWVCKSHNSDVPSLTDTVYVQGLRLLKADEVHRLVPSILYSKVALESVEDALITSIVPSAAQVGWVRLVPNATVLDVDHTTTDWSSNSQLFVSSISTIYVPAASQVRSSTVEPFDRL